MLAVKANSLRKPENPLSQSMRSVRYAFWVVGLFSLAINLLMLTGPLFMLQVYDRVLSSQSVPTLVALFGLVVALYCFLGLFDFFRARILSRVGYYLDGKLAQPSLKVWIAGRLAGRPDIGRPVMDLSSIRSFLGSQGLPALFDLPWAPIYLLIVFFMHFYLGVLALVGLLFVIVLAISNELLTRKPIGEGGYAEGKESQFAEHAVRNAETIVSLGMSSHISKYWSALRDAAKERTQAGGDLSEGFTSTSKSIRMLLQSAILALGAYLAIKGQISAGTIVAASILAGRALAPVDQTIGNWRNILRARQAYRRLLDSLAYHVASQKTINLPAPKGVIEVRQVIKFAPNSLAVDGGARRPILQGLNFALKPGDALGVIGPSASGKSTLARLLVGLTTPDQGSIRLDGATFDQWDPDRLGRHIGYLPQAVELLPGTLKQNIARFDETANDDEVIAAAQLAGAHELIVRLPNGYATEIGFGQPPLSGGQAQRIALARALFRQPKLIVLDEPSSNLDVEGDVALTQAITAMRNAGSVIFIMTHRPPTIAAANLVLMLRDGRQVEFGEKDEVILRVTKSSDAPPSGGPDGSKRPPPIPSTSPPQGAHADIRNQDPEAVSPVTPPANGDGVPHAGGSYLKEATGAASAPQGHGQPASPGSDGRKTEFLTISGTSSQPLDVQPGVGSRGQRDPEN